MFFYIRVKKHFDSFASKTVEVIVRDLHVARHNNTGYTGCKIKTSRLASVARKDGVLGEENSIGDMDVAGINTLVLDR